MTRIEAIIKPFKLDEVKEALRELGIWGMTVVESKGFGRRGGRTELYRGAECVVDFLPHVLIILYVSDDLAALAVSAILSSAHTGRIGDGIVTVVDLEYSVNIRTGSTGNDAL